MGTRPIRIDSEVKAALVARRRPEERNFSDVIRRLLGMHLPGCGCSVCAEQRFLSEEATLHAPNARFE